MQYTVAEYVVLPEKRKAVKRALHEFVSKVRLHEPRTLYLVFWDEANGSFIHVMSFEDDAAEHRHSQSPYAGRFARIISPHCIGRPRFSEMDLSSASRKQWALAPPAPKRGRALRTRPPRAPSLRFP